MKEFIKKLKLALADKDTAEELKKFGIEAENLEGLEDLEKPETLDEALKQFNLQSDFDKRVDKALKTREDNLKAKYDFVEKEQPKEDKTKVDTDNPAMQAILDQMQKMSDELKNIKQEKAQESLAQKKERAVKLLSEKGIPKTYRHEFDYEKDLEEQLETVSNIFVEDGGSFKSEEKSRSRIPFPKKPAATNQPSKEEVEAFKSKI